MNDIPNRQAKARDAYTVARSAYHGIRRASRLGLGKGDGVTALSGWENFYVIVGSSAGALIGLQFVVMTLLADTPMGHGSAQAGEAFGTPTIVHLGSVLLLAAILSAPWHAIAPAAILCALLGFSGTVYAAIVIRRMRQQTAYQPEFEDWLFHVALPFAGYVALFASGLAARFYGVEGQFCEIKLRIRPQTEKLQGRMVVRTKQGYYR